MEHKSKVLAVVSVAVFMAGLDLFIVNIAFPDIVREYDEAGISATSWVLNAYTIVFAALLIPAGRLADRIGRKRAFLGGLVGFVVGSALCGVAPSIETLVGARILQAIGAAFILPTSLALLLVEFPPAERAAAIGIWAAIGGVAAAVGPPLGGLLVEVDWRLIFFVNIPVGLGAFAVALPLLRESADPEQEPADPLGTALLTAAIGLLVLGLVEAPDWGWADLRTIGSIAAAAAMLRWFWARCRSHRSPVVEPSMLAVPTFGLASLATLLFAAGFGAMLLISVLFLTTVWGASALEAGLQIAPGPALAAIFAVLAGRWSERVGSARLATLGLAVFAISSCWWALAVGPESAYAAEFLPAMLLSGVGVGLILPTLADIAVSSLPPARLATGTAVYTTSRQLGFALGVGVLIAILGSAGTDALSGFQAGWVFIAAICLAAMGAAATAWRVGEVSTSPGIRGSEVSA